MNSPWGWLGQLCGDDPTRLDKILETVSWTNLVMLSSDKARMVKRKDIVEKVNKIDLKAHRERFNG
ncbi:hypothetical protein [Sphingobacterium psychroaquaticum]|uniref:Uncharacterized protein n=1 Tax=Sphingobacterium psychroaquaticum TaxID=561061 RepID=A0A1X7K585_9SPHI|nr:hypothetical protein [Sphingobacterium psychroaquaticum]SMG35378.1 hypothetical protein SAMN05660862_2518 [Sphingobacterium psychroaquaticum]